MRVVSGVVWGSIIASTNVALANVASLPNLTRTTSAITTLDDVYLLGPGDLIGIDVFNVPEYNSEQHVLANGMVNLPAIGQVSLVGLTIPQAERAISDAYHSKIRYPRITISLLAPRQLRIAIAGEIYRPGVYTIPVNEADQFPTLVDAIQLAGGVTQTADLEQVRIQRSLENGDTQSVVSNLATLIGQGDLQQDISLRDGDAITVSPTDEIDLRASNELATSNLATDEEEAISVVVVGEVFRPGTYNYASRRASNQSVAVGNDTTANTVQQPGRLTVTRALRLAGGIKPLADMRRVEVKRTTRSGESRTISLDLWQLVETGENNQDLVLQTGDTIFVHTAVSANPEQISRLTATNLSPDTISVNVVGEVEQPGTVNVVANTTLNQAVLAAGGFNRRAKEETVELIRLNPNGSVTRRVIEVDLAQGLDSESNPIVQHNDIVVVDPSAAARLSDNLGVLLNPFLQILPILNFAN